MAVLYQRHHGKPKGVMLTHRNLMTMGLTYFADVDAVDPREAIVSGPPMSHGAGLYAIHGGAPTYAADIERALP